MTLSDTPGAPCWIELFTTDTQDAARFYGGLFGWDVESSGPDYGNYAIFSMDGRKIAGLMKKEADVGAPSAWSVYLETDDVAATVEKAKANGGQVMFEPMQVGEMGHMTFLVDPAGAAVGAWQPLAHQGFDVLAEPGAAAWFEVLTKDYDKAVPFYRDVFGWDPHTMSDTPEFRYTTLGVDDQAKAGIMDAAGFLGETPSHWRPYLLVQDTDAAVLKATELGGSVVQSAADSPYGRLAVLADPQGVPFSVIDSTTAQA
jgi:uncharacterized protein